MPFLFHVKRSRIGLKASDGLEREFGILGLEKWFFVDYTTASLNSFQ